MRFDREVGDGSRSDSEGGEQGPEEVAERPSQGPNGNAVRLHDYRTSIGSSPFAHVSSTSRNLGTNRLVVMRVYASGGGVVAAE